MFGAETAFWARLLDRDPVTGSRPEFVVLEREPGSPLRVLVQRLDVAPADGVVSGHLDLACDDVAAAVARHRSLGAAVVGSGPVWTVLTDPGGVVYCLTARSPDSGRLAG